MKWSRHLLFACLLFLPPALPPGSAAGEMPQPSAQQRQVTLNFTNVEITVFVRFVAEVTGQNFIIDQRVRGSVTVLAPTRIPVADLYSVLESVLQVHGFSAVEAGQAVKIVPTGEARAMNIDTQPAAEPPSPGDELVTRIIPLEHAGADELQPLLRPLISRNALIGALATVNVLVVTDTAAVVRRLVKIIREVDVPDNRREVAVILLAHANGEKLADLLASLFPSPAAARRRRPPTAAAFMADGRTNQLVVIAPKADMRRIKDVVSLLDKKALRERAKIRVYYLKNANADELAKVLQDLAGEGRGVVPDEGTRTLFSQATGVYADAATNSLIVSAESNAELQALEEVIDQLDSPREMVQVEVLIMEVDAREDLRLGVEWTAVGETRVGGEQAAIGGGFVQAPAASALPGFVNGSFPTGFSIGVFTEAIDIAGIQFNNLAAVIQAVKEKRGVNILSTPQILTTDQEEAQITVARNIPFQTSTSTTFNQSFNSFEYRDVGTILKVTPQISAEETVRLNVGLEVSMLESTTDFRPTTFKRTVDTSVLVEDGATVVIGGLLEDSPARSANKVPLLGDVPLLGRFFTYQTEARQQTNLLVFLTPRVFRKAADAYGRALEKKDRLERLTENSAASNEPPFRK
jgi:general secretion pathway protein D